MKFKKILSLIPKPMMAKFIRSRFHVPDLTLDPNFVIKIAETQEELEAAYTLLHECYVGQRLMEPDPSNLRCTLYSLLPETTTIIAKYKGKTVGTITLLNDSAVGLPSDEKFHSENNSLRAEKHKLIEVSSLAVSKEFRSTNHAVSLLLMKYCYNYAPKMGGTNLVITIHPRAEQFYSSLIHFTKKGSVVEYNYVNGALAVYMYCPLLEPTILTKWAASFKNDNFRKNMALWILNYEDIRFIYPKMDSIQATTPVLTPDLMEYFFVKKTNLLEKLCEDKRKIFFQVLTHFFGEKEIQRFSNYYGSYPIKEFRTTINLSSGLEVDDQFFIVNIGNISTNGAYINHSHDPHFKIKKGDSVSLRFKIGAKSFHVRASVVWIKRYNDEEPIGFGVRFATELRDIKDEIRALEIGAYKSLAG